MLNKKRLNNLEEKITELENRIKALESSNEKLREMVAAIITDLILNVGNKDALKKYV